MRAFVLVTTLAPLVPLASSCASTNNTRIAEITVAAYLTPCATFEVLDCMVVDDGGKPDIYDSNDGIEGFTYHWGSASGRQIVCDDPAVCTAIADALQHPAAFDLTMRHPDDPGQRSGAAHCGCHRLSLICCPLTRSSCAAGTASQSRVR
jgi:hypothetical protein